ncbi:MAG: hypothetical protein IJU98_10450 [Synergistaceae bacterium]|nr:hypothetical protein [Synergistaceae bacterium]
MLKRMVSFVAVLSVFSLFLTGAACLRAEAKVRLGVLKFEGRAEELKDSAGAAVGDLFIKILFKSKGLTLVERERLESLALEHGLTKDGFMSSNTATQVGNLTGCDYILTGAITNLARGESGGSVGIGRVPLLGGLGLGGGVGKEKVRATLDVRVIDVKTGEIVFVDTAEGDASKSENNVSIIGVNLRNSEMAGPEGVAMAKAVAALAPKIEMALTGEDTLSEILNLDGKKGAKKEKTSGKPETKKEKKLKPNVETVDEDEKRPSQADGHRGKPAFENKSTDPSRVISTYGLSAGEANTLRIKHINIRKFGNTQKAYKAYAGLFESVKGDYLAAFMAGEVARNLKDKERAKAWYDKALEINPDYEPAQKAKAGLSSSSSRKKKTR